MRLIPRFKPLILIRFYAVGIKRYCTPIVQRLITILTDNALLTFG